MNCNKCTKNLNKDLFCTTCNLQTMRFFCNQCNKKFFHILEPKIFCKNCDHKYIQHIS